MRIKKGLKIAEGKIKEKEKALLQLETKPFPFKCRIISIKAAGISDPDNQDWVISGTIYICSTSLQATLCFL